MKYGIIALVLATAGCSLGNPPHPQISVRGTFDPDAVKLVSTTVNHQATVILDSQGGNYENAVEMAQAVYWSEAATRVDGICASDCVLVFAAGKRRSMSPGSEIGVHGLIGAVADEIAEAQIMRNLGVPPRIIGEMAGTPYWTIHWLTPAELAQWGVETTP